MLGKTILHYKIIEKLGEGGMGVVYKAEDSKLDRMVAIKFLPRRVAADEQKRERFKIEAKAAAKLNHPNIATIHAIEEIDDEIFIVMEFIDGRELRALIRDGISEADAITYATQIAEGLQAAHQKGITHRDIKSTNIMVTTAGRVKVMDFGLAKIGGGAQITQEDSTVGTIAYMSPEQSRGEAVDQRTDIWAFGIVLYEMFAGETPFRGEYEQAVIYSILNEQPILEPDFPKSLSKIVSKALEKQPKDRYQDVASLLTALKAGDSQETTTDSEHSKNEAIKPPAAKRNLAIAGGIMLLFLLIAAIVYFQPSENTSAQFDSIAVLPLDNLSADPNQEYFADGMTEALITDLAQVSALKVISRTSVMRYKGTTKSLPEIAKELQVATILEGSVQRHGEQVRISAQLIEAATDKHLWAQSYEYEIKNVLALQSEVARAIVKEIRIKLTPEEERRLTKSAEVNPAAYEDYLKGQFYYSQHTKASYLKSIEYFKLALEKDPNYAPAYGRMAYSYIALGQWTFLPLRKVFPEARKAAEKSLAIDSTEIFALAALGVVKMLSDYDWAGAEAAFNKVSELSPNNNRANGLKGWMYWVRGKPKAALSAFTKSLELDPQGVARIWSLSRAYKYVGQHGQAITLLEKALEFHPNHFALHLFISEAYEQNGRYDDAIKSAEKARQLSGDAAYALVRHGSAYAAAGKKLEAEKILRELEKRALKEFVTPAAFAFLYAALGEKEKAMDWLEREYIERTSDALLRLNVSPYWDSFRNEPRFIALMEKMAFDK